MSFTKVIVAIIGYLLTANYAVGQVYFYVEDNNGLAISDAVISVTSLSKAGKSETSWTDTKGKATISIKPPFIIQISHLNFHSHSDTIRNSASFNYQLEAKSSTLKEVVVTGQYEAQSAKNAVYQVKTVNSEVIKAMGATNLEEVLSQQLNIRFSRDNAVGNGRINMQGLSGQYVKILIDGVPMVGRTGTGNEIDLNQINVQMIDRVEIVEGPMAVNYGADALAGVINIITKKETDQSVFLNLSIQEETVGNEYSLLEDGIHNYSLRFGGRITSNLNGEIQSRWNHFGGWTGAGEGRNKEWYPKTQWMNSGRLNYTANQWNLSYQLQQLSEEILDLGNINSNNPLLDPFATDQAFNTVRWMHQLQAGFSLGNWKLNSANSFTDYSRTTAQYNTNMVTGKETPTVATEQDTIFYQSWFSRNTFQGKLFTAFDWTANGQLGLESTYELAGGTTLSDGYKELTDVAFFASTELNYKIRLKVRPGIRYTVNSIFHTLPTPSVNVKYDINSYVQIRAGYGRGFRAPSIRELYHEFIDANHNIIGNELLQPETSHSYTANLNFRFSDKLKINSGAFYNDINDKIGFYTPERADLPTTYQNISVFKTKGINAGLRYNVKQLQLQAGTAFIGRYQQLSEDAPTEVPEFIYSPEANLSIQYHFPAVGLQTAFFYKFTGANKDYRLVNDESGGTQAELQQIDPFHWLDLTLTQSISSQFSMSAGIKNLLNIETINDNLSGGAHSGGNSGQTSVAYGRSFFLRLQYQFSKPINK
ncbi:TonB-dependent receptor [Marivirga sp. S37H4]|uniref:TonB-dependent receptor n=1 Tax=Marivirga aurantiaca TaxID=2802615 RepID=A0A935C7L4_9BACT|nr:TonB-dependent receptor [Marivirga aurantiaca]MBK6264432.1 TonB-dependent receptor [Marivirga aurantiaca]